MKNEAGFTLIEIIVSLILVGIMASVAGMGIVAGIQGYLFAKDNAAVSGKAQLAMSRLTRTFVEVLDITTVGSSPTRITYNRLSGGVSTTETIYLNTADNTVKIASGGSATGGDTLVDHVNSLALTYKKGVPNWVPGTDDFSLLSTVGVTLELTRPSGGSNVTFSTVITPRNNANRGGSTVTTVPTAPPGGCFVATAAFGQPDHPMVLLLREFRDRYLLTWAGGRMIVKMYYAGGPYLADLIRNRGWACTLTQWALLPFTGTVFLMLYAPQAVPFILLLSWVAVTIFFKLIRRKQKMVASVPMNQRGTILLALIGTMVVFSILGAAMLSFTNSSIFNQLTSTGSTRAYYLAEGGMRYAGSQFKNAGTGEDVKDDMLESLNGHDFSMGGDGTFHLDAYPYYFKTTAIPSGTTLSAKFPGAVPPSPYSLPTSGYLKIGNIPQQPPQYTNYTQSGSNITFTMSAALAGYTAAVNNVLPVGLASATTLTKGGTLTLSSGAGAFPLVNGTFTIGTSTSTTGANPAVFAYKTRSGNALQQVTLSQTPNDTFSVSVPTSAYVTSMKFVNVRSTGTYTPLQASRTISYSVPIGWVSGSGSGGKSQFTDKFDDLSHWNVGTGELGTHEIKNDANTDNSNALHVKTTYQYGLLSGLYYDRASLLTLNWTSTGVDLNQSWNLAGKYLSYDSQAKVKVVNQPKYYMAGIVFRINTSTGNSYGVSFLRPNKGYTLLWDKDSIPDDLCPLADSNHDTLIVLWEQTSSGNVQWLAYKVLTGVDTGAGGVIDASGNLVPWATILVRVIEAASLEFNTGTGPTPLVGDIITGANGATARVNGTPILTSGAWEGTNAAGVLTIDTLGATPFVSGTLTVTRGTSTIATVNYTGTYRQRDNYIRVYYGTTANKGTANSSPLDYNRLGNARITTTQTLNWPVDNVSDWAAANDTLTLVQWNDNLQLTNGNAVRLGTGSELNAIIRTNLLTTDPAQTTFTSPEIGVDTWGTDSTSIYFDDFGIQTAAPGQTQGFLPAIQQ
jgi:prepilin-type N-terminal cleavage/methylation domain-containing protein